MRILLGVLAGCCPLLGGAARADEPLRPRAEKALRRAVEFYRTRVGVEGGYLWRYSDDLKRREGEGKATDTTAWVQPPGTPSVGFAYLAAWEGTGDRYYLDAARETALALVKGQLRSGGWDYRIEFAPADRKKNAYRTDSADDKARNVSTLDDNTTQSALRFLMRVDKALDFKDEKVHEAALFGLTTLLKVQYPNGAWPQRFERPPDAEKFPVKKASFPEEWSRTWPGGDYRGHYTLNDNTLADCIDLMLEAEQVYGGGKYKKAAERAGDFLLLAQLPDPQPGWAQQYDADMRPAWARKFEPPAVTGGESQNAMLTLLVLYQATGDKKYLEPIPKALAYYSKSLLSDGRLARFYEMKTNKPLYFTKDYKLTYEDNDLPTHYGFKVGSKLDRIEKEHDRLKKLKPEQLKWPPVAGKPTLSDAVTARAKAAVEALDDRGRWVEDGKLRSHGADDPTRRILNSQTFARHVEALSAYLRACKP